MKGKRWFEIDLQNPSIIDTPLNDYYVVQKEAIEKIAQGGLTSRNGGQRLKPMLNGKASKNTIVGRVGPGDYIIQPEYMTIAGSMCVTELWTDKQKRTYQDRFKKKDALSFFDEETRDFVKDHGLIKPGHIKERKELIAASQRMRQNLSKESIIKKENRFSREKFLQNLYPISNSKSQPKTSFTSKKQP
eukprot:TRINITY_DN498_c1_g1_i1.p1 TRINITY_DN498_c1_g1~~TRINITY_DN498_c1_g1_i1.p1  ORF type:complete len:189 (-),score=27.85 TRINITY_DN498_c1_g1_i1:53-619(-)